MKNITETPEEISDKNEEDLKAAAKRREDYALSRNLLAEDNNEAIIRRLSKDKEKEA